MVLEIPKNSKSFQKLVCDWSKQVVFRFPDRQHTKRNFSQKWSLNTICGYFSIKISFLSKKHLSLHVHIFDIDILGIRVRWTRTRARIRWKYQTREISNLGDAAFWSQLSMQLLSPFENWSEPVCAYQEYFLKNDVRKVYLIHVPRIFSISALKLD